MSDLTAQATEAVAQELVCKITTIRKFGEDVYVTRLESTESLPDFRPGQYLNMCLSDGIWRPFSIASHPRHHKAIELHIRKLPGHTEAEHIIGQLKNDDTARIQLPFGRCLLRSGIRPVIFIAGGTGFAPFKPMIEDALGQESRRDLYLFWGAKTVTDLYLHELPLSWAEKHENFHYVPVLSEPDEQWFGNTGLVHKSVLHGFSDLKPFEIYIGGSEPMVMAVYQDLLARGLADKQIHSDILDIKLDMGELPAREAAMRG